MKPARRGLETIQVSQTQLFMRGHWLKKELCYSYKGRIINGFNKQADDFNLF